MLLVTGGVLDGQALDSTEILTEGASHWIYSGPLPSPRRELRAATIGNKLLVTGEILFDQYLSMCPVYVKLQCLYETLCLTLFWGELGVTLGRPRGDAGAASG